jgi:hypothetical protein
MDLARPRAPAEQHIPISLLNKLDFKAAAKFAHYAAKPRRTAIS